MRAVMFVPRPGGASVEVADVPKPEPAAGEVLVGVRAAGLNRGEMSIRRSLTSGAPQQTGIEFAGEVAEAAPVRRLPRPGDRVMGNGAAGRVRRADERWAGAAAPAGSRAARG